MKMKQIKHIRIKIVLLTLLVSLLTSCRLLESISEYNLPTEFDSDKPNKPPKATAEPSSFVKTHIALAASTFSSLHPYAPQEKSMESILKLSYQGLLTMTSDGRMTGQLADEAVLSEDGLSCQIILGEKYFHDGSPVGLKDIQYSHKLASAGKYADQVAVIQKISGKSDQEIRIDFTKPGLTNLYVLSFPIVKAGSLEKANHPGINGTGPYQLESYKPKQVLTLKSPSNSLEISLSRKEDVYRNAFLNGLTDIYFTEEFEWLSFSEEKLKSIHVFPSNQFYYMGLQSQTPLFADIQIRKYLFDKLAKETLVKKAFLNHLVMQKIPFPRGDQWEKTVEVSPMEDEDAKLDANPIPAGQKLRLIYPEGDKTLELLANGIVDDWLPYVTIEATKLGKKEFEETILKKEFDIYLTKMSTSQYPNLREYLGTQGKYNYSDLSLYDTAIEQLLTSKTEEEQKKNYLSLAASVGESYWIYPFGFIENAVIMSNQVDGPISPKTFDYLSGIGELKIVTKQ